MVRKRLRQLFIWKLIFIMFLVTLVAPGTVLANDDVMKDQDDSIVGYDGAVATEDPDASKAAMRILDNGGNAVDAAIAAAAVQGVTRPFSGGIGGGGMMLIYLAEEDKYISIDNRSQATQAFGPDAFLNPNNDLIYPQDTRISSGVATSVPGAVKAWEEAINEYGTMTLSEVLQPAIDIARDGFMVDSNFVREANANADRFNLFKSTKEVYLDENGKWPEAGTIFANPDLAETYRLLGEHGSDIFYEGEIAEEIVETVNNPPVVDDPDFSVLEGEMTMEDLINYEPITGEPTHSTYKGYDVYGAPPSSSGGLTISHTLNILEDYDLKNMSRVQAFHYFMEATRLSFADRREYIGDPAFTEIPSEGFLSKEYAAERRQLIDDDLAEVGQIAPGNPWKLGDGPEDSDLALDYDFSGEDGSPWEMSKFHRLDTGPTSSPFDSKLDIINNTGRLLINEQNPEQRSAYGRATSSMAATENSELNIRFKTDNLDDNQRLRLWLQGDVWRPGSTIPVNGYGVEINLNTNELLLRRSKDSTLRTLDSMDIDMDTEWKDLRFRVEGNVLKASMWNSDEEEPVEWDFNHTLVENDTLDDQRGKFLLSGINFNELSNVTFNFDEVSVEDLGHIEHREVEGSSQSNQPTESKQEQAEEETIHFEKNEVNEEDLEEAFDQEEEQGGDESTIHLAVSDEDGNIVSYTSTIVSIGGNGMVVPGRGFLLNNALSGRTPGQHPSHPNYPRPGMRSMSSMSPTLIMKDGEPILTFGSPGSDTILTTVLQVVLNHLEFDMPLNEAIADPRMNQRNNFDGLANYEQIFYNLDEDFTELVEGLEDKGHKFSPARATQGIGAVTGIEFLPNGQVMPATEQVRRGGGSAMVQSMFMFNDISSNDRFRDEIQFLANRQIINGFPDGSFRQGHTVTRAQAAIMIGRTLELDGEKRDVDFPDVDRSMIASGYIQSAVEEGIIQGFPDGKYRPEETVTRGQMAIFIARAFELEKESELAFSDVKPNMQAYTSIKRILAEEITQGYPDGTYRPDEGVTRGQFSAFLSRALDESFR